MLSDGVIFVTIPAKFQCLDFEDYPNERAMLRNCVSELRFLASLIMKIPEERVFEVLPEAKVKGLVFAAELRLIYGWLEIIHKAKPSTAKEIFYKCSRFISTVHESIKSNV